MKGSEDFSAFLLFATCSYSQDNHKYIVMNLFYITSQKMILLSSVLIILANILLPNQTWVCSPNAQQSQSTDSGFFLQHFLQGTQCAAKQGEQSVAHARCPDGF